MKKVVSISVFSVGNFPLPETMVTSISNVPIQRFLRQPQGNSLKLPEKTQHPRSIEMPRLTRQQNTQQLVDFVINNNW